MQKKSGIMKSGLTRHASFPPRRSVNDNFLFTGQHCDTDTNYNGANLAQSLQMGQRKAHGAILL